MINSADCINLIGVKVGNKYYINSDTQNGLYRYIKLCDFKINGDFPKRSFHSDWYVINDTPQNVQIKKSRSCINQRFELKDKTLADVTDKFPLVLTMESVGAKFYDDEWNDEYASIKSLYEYQCDIEEEKYIPIEFTYETILTLKSINSPETVVHTKNVQYSRLAQILFPSIALPNTECKLTAEESYRIIREHVKRNINPKYATVTSDYDFCFTVEKVIKLAERESYKVDVNAFRKRAKPKYETQYRYDKRIKCFEIAPKPYNSYPVVKPFSANNQNELEEKIQTYLDDLMKKINEPIKYCKCCKGTGVIIDED